MRLPPFFCFVRLFSENFLMSPKGPPFNLVDFLQQKNPKGSPFFRFFGTLRLLKFLIFSFFSKFFLDSKGSPFFKKICNRMDVKKSQSPPPFYSFRHCEIFKNSFRPKIRFSQAQHAISDFVFFFKKTGFFLCDFFLKKIVFTQAPRNFYKERNVL